MAEAPDFGFVTDEELRASLESDYGELRACLSSSSWKAAQVLSGSIVEAVLVDYLLGIEYSKKSPLEMTLKELVSAARSEGALDETAESLSTVIRGFRNLIHPGRVIRLKETVDEDGAYVAERLVSMIVRGVAAKQEQQFGLTAEQILAKFEADASVLPITNHLVAEMRSPQLERLLLALLPERFLALSAEDRTNEDLETLNRLEHLFHLAYGRASEAVQKKVARAFVAVLREEAGQKVEVYEDHLFRGHFLAHLSEADRTLVKAHLFARMKKGQLRAAQVASIEGLGAYVKSDEVSALVDPLVRTAAYSRDEDLRDGALGRIEDEFWSLHSHLDDEFAERLDTWVEFLRTKDQTEAADRIAAVSMAIRTADNDIPF